MSAESLTTAAALFAGPGSASNFTPSLNSSTGFHFVLDDTIQTLSTHNAPNSGPIKGLLFVPELYPEDPCYDITAQYVPYNVTRYEDVSLFGYDTIGLAPWVSVDCTHSFLSATRNTMAQALVFFQPFSNDTGKPPSPDNVTWSLGDGGDWKNVNDYPVYAIPGPAGATLLHQLSLNSGNETSLINRYNNESDYDGDIRLFTLINLDDAGKKMPSLWGFVLAILGTILVLSIILLICYQFVQKRRRDNLQRRIESGEADLEYLGLNQVKVPQEVLDKIPVYTYPDLNAPSKAILADKDHSSVDRLNDRSSIKSTEDKGRIQGDEYELKQLETAATRFGSRNNTESVASHNPGRESYRLSHSQTTCAICLDDYIPGSSVVRELPCGHIFHTECIDTFLTQSSSLCPLCKKSVLPPGCYPHPITNVMVHRDYMQRRTGH